mmetsp:Transcript_1228/g.2631  ORF Transcript_1228/g.2631 Transcript_1228/m.2631 type:complete len:613 (+) Transcript_1228:185-2023(+)
MPADITIFLVRHGTSEWNLLKKWQGTTDTNLAPEGIQQAKSRALSFAASGILFDACVTSDLKRAAKTADVLMSACGQKKTPQPDPRLRECTLGEFEGLTKSVIYGPRYQALWDRLSGLGHEQRLRTPYFEGLETPFEVGHRAAQGIVDVALRTASNMGGSKAVTVLAVTHSTVIESILAALFGADFDSVDSSNLGFIKLKLVQQQGTEGGGEGWPTKLLIEGTEGIDFRPSPDAVANDPDASRLLGLAPGLVFLPSKASTTGDSRRWLKATMGMALVLGLAGLAEIVRTGGKIGAETAVAAPSSPPPAQGGKGAQQQQPVAARAGRWGPVSASVDWCEENYAVTWHVAEFFNAASSLLLVASGVWAASEARRSRAEPRYAALGWLLALVGIGSVGYHSTLRKSEQALDEVPMLWVATLASFCVLRQGQVDPRQVPGGPNKEWRPFVGPAMAVYAACLSALQWLSSSAWQPVAFHLSFGSAELFFLWGAWQQYQRSRYDPRFSAVFERAFALYAAAVGSWALDNAFCGHLRYLFGRLTDGLCPYPHLHALGWHGGVALASGLLIVAGTAERLAFMNAHLGPKAARVWLRPHPVLGFFLPKISCLDADSQPAKN